jgi:hypothetical protein
MVGLNDKKYNRGIEQLYEGLRKKQNLELTVAYDSVLVDKWNINAMPYIIIIDPDGIVRAITDGRDMTQEKIQDLIDRKNVEFFPAQLDRPLFNVDDVSSIKDKIIYQTVITKWNGESQIMPVRLGGNFGGIRDLGAYAKLEVTAASLEWLYKLAYTGYGSWQLTTDSLYGKFQTKAMLEVKDPSLFKYNYTSLTDGGLYNYILVVPSSLSSVSSVMGIMQQDLKKIFKFEVSIETRKSHVWLLVRTSSTQEVLNLKTKGGEPFFSSQDASGGAAGFTLRNQPVNFLLALIARYIYINEIPFLDETGIEGNIDITVDALMTDINDIKKALQKSGLDLVKGEKEMKVLIIRDTKD